MIKTLEDALERVKKWPRQRQEDVARVIEAMEHSGADLYQLSDAEREVVMLRHFSDLSFSDIAAMMNTPIGTALARAHRGLGRLRQLMTKPPD